MSQRFHLFTFRADSTFLVRSFFTFANAFLGIKVHSPKTPTIHGLVCIQVVDIGLAVLIYSLTNYSSTNGICFLINLYPFLSLLFPLLANTPPKMTLLLAPFVVYRLSSDANTWSARSFIVAIT